MSFTPEFLDELRSRVRLVDLIGKRVKLTRRGSRFVGLCPFHNEKTPSFHVNDSEGFYHCFGCGVHGDAISYVREVDGLDFVEAIEHLAPLAGMSIPADAKMPQNPERAQKRHDAFTALGHAASYYRHALTQHAQSQAYLKQRGLSAELIAEYQLGYAPKRGLFAQLQQHGISKPMAMETGLAGISTRDNEVYDYFRDRLMFPIHDRKGRVVAFGARAFGDAQPKYLNSPETPIFSKKGIVYGLPQARQRLKKSLPLLVVEGYMDVIAVSATPLAAALAPLGTALSEQQMQLIWKLHPEPILCFDGDSAGRRAASRAVTQILPHIQAGKNIRIASLPDGQDPDDILKTQGSAGLTRLIERAQGILDYVWSERSAAHDLDNPRTQATARAKFRDELYDLFRTITHSQTRSAYLDDLTRRFTLARDAYRFPSKRGPKSASPPSSTLAQAKLNRPKTGVEISYQALLALLISFPEHFIDIAEPLSRLEFASPALESLKKAIIDELNADMGLDSESLKVHLEGLGYTDIMSRLFGKDMMDRMALDFQSMTSMRARCDIDGLIERLSRSSRLAPRIGGRILSMQGDSFHGS